MHAACFPPQPQRAQMFQLLSCEGALQSLLKATRKSRKQYCRKREEKERLTEKERERGQKIKERERETETEQRQRQRQRRRKRKRNKKEKEKRKRKRKRGARVRVMVRVRRPTHAFRRAFWQCTLSTYTRIKVRGDNTVFTKRADQRYTVTCMCAKRKGAAVVHHWARTGVVSTVATGIRPRKPLH